MRRLIALACALIPAALPAQAAFHCFYEDTNLGYILEPEQGAVTVWGGIVPQRLDVQTVQTGSDPLMEAVARTVIDSPRPAPDFLPMVVTEVFTLTGPDTLRLEVVTDWQKQDGSAFPSWFVASDFAPEPFVPGTWQMPCEATAAVRLGE